MPLGYNFLASISKSRPEIKNRCTLESVNRQKLAAIPKSRLEIQNHCTLEVVSGQKLAAIPKSGLEIKNRCRTEVVSRQNHAAIPKSGPEIKNRCSSGFATTVCMRNHSLLSQGKLESDAADRRRYNRCRRAILRC